MKSDRATLTAKRSIVYVLMIVFTIIAVVPIYLMLINATRSNAQINEGLSFLPGGNTMTNWKNLTNRNFQIWQGFSNSAFISVCCTVLGVYFSTLTAYAIHVYRFKGRNFLWAFILIVIMIPGTLSFIGFYQFMAKCHLTNSFIPLIVPTIASAGRFIQNESIACLQKFRKAFSSFARFWRKKSFKNQSFSTSTGNAYKRSKCAWAWNWNNLMTRFSYKTCKNCSRIAYSWSSCITCVSDIFAFVKKLNNFFTCKRFILRTTTYKRLTDFKMC